MCTVCCQWSAGTAPVFVSLSTSWWEHYSVSIWYSIIQSVNSLIELLKSNQFYSFLLLSNFVTFPIKSLIMRLDIDLCANHLFKGHFIEIRTTVLEFTFGCWWDFGVYAVLYLNKFKIFFINFQLFWKFETTWKR